MQLNPNVLHSHRQLDQYSCIPMSVEFVLKLLGRVPLDYFDLQREWQNRTDGSFALFDGRVIAGLRFRVRFALPRDEHFPLDELFDTIESELPAPRYVIISLAVNGGWHMYVVHEVLPNGGFGAISKALTGETLVTKQVREIVRGMKGTDILVYELFEEV